MHGNGVEGATLLDAAIDAGFGRYPWLTTNLLRGKAFRASEFTGPVQRLETIIAEQLELVEAQDASEDFRAEFERMLDEASQ
jgi:hypothetical protein